MFEHGECYWDGKKSNYIENVRVEINHWVARVNISFDRDISYSAACSAKDAGKTGYPHVEEWKLIHTFHHVLKSV